MGRKEGNKGGKRRQKKYKKLWEYVGETPSQTEVKGWSKQLFQVNGCLSWTSNNQKMKEETGLGKVGYV